MTQIFQQSFQETKWGKTVGQKIMRIVFNQLRNVTFHTTGLNPKSSHVGFVMQEVPLWHFSTEYVVIPAHCNFTDM
jgi:hypothetical protein